MSALPEFIGVVSGVDPKQTSRAEVSTFPETGPYSMSREGGFIFLRVCHSITNVPANVIAENIAMQNVGADKMSSLSGLREIKKAIKVSKVNPRLFINIIFNIT